MFKLHRHTSSQNHGLIRCPTTKLGQGPPKVILLHHSSNMDTTIISETTTDISNPSRGDASQQSNQRSSMHTGKVSSINRYLNSASQQDSASEDDRDASQYEHSASQQGSASKYIGFTNQPEQPEQLEQPE